MLHPIIMRKTEYGITIEIILIIISVADLQCVDIKNKNRRVIYIENTTQLQEKPLQMPWWNKFTFSVQEASEYFGFSDKKLRKLIDENENANFILWNGTRPRIKRILFEQFVNEKLTAI